MIPKRKYRILGLHWGFTPGGVTRYAASLENIKLHNAIDFKSVCIILPKSPVDHKTASQIEIEFIRVRSRFDLAWIWKVRKKLKEEKPDLVFTFGVNGCFVSALTSFGLGITTVSSWHGTWYGTSFLSKLRAPGLNFLSTILLKYFVNHIVTVSDFSKRTLIKQSIDQRKIKRIYNGIPVLTPKGSRAIKNKDEALGSTRKIFIGTFCRLDATKDLPTLLKAIHMVTKIMTNLEFCIWGEGPLKKKLINIAKGLKIEKYVKFAGFTSSVEDKLQNLDIFILPSKVENLSLALLEAMRAGLPIIATNIGGNPEAVEHNKQALLVAPQNPSALAEAIIRLANDSDLRFRIGSEASKRFHQKFRSETMVMETSKWLIECAKSL